MGNYYKPHPSTQAILDGMKAWMHGLETIKPASVAEALEQILTAQEVNVSTAGLWTRDKRTAQEGEKPRGYRDKLASEDKRAKIVDEILNDVEELDGLTDFHRRELAYKIADSLDELALPTPPKAGEYCPNAPLKAGEMCFCGKPIKPKEDE